MKNKILMPLATLGAVGLTLAVPGVAMAATAQSGGGATYQANLQPIPLSGSDSASGHLTLTLNGDQATVSETVSGLAKTIPTDPATLKAVHIPQSLAGKPFPHVQHIHGPDAALGTGGVGQCPGASADANHDGIINTPEAQPQYGPILTSLSVAPGGTGGMKTMDPTDVTVAPSGGSFTYDRTITLDSATLQSLRSGTAVIVVHGLDPATAPKASLTTPNSVGLTLPGETQPVALVATAPALCGSLSAMPAGAVGTGGGGTAGLQHEGLIGLGGGLIALGGLGAGAVALQRRRVNA